MYTMSRRAASDTRVLILEAARAAMEDGHYHESGLGDIARRAGCSRQAVYLHFGSKAGLFGELMTFVEERERLADLLAGVRDAPTGREALDRLVAVHATFEPRIARLASAFEQARIVDPTFGDLYDQRMRWRYDGMRTIVLRLHDEGDLADGWTVDTAAAFVWTLTAPAAFRLLVADRGWSHRRWRTETTRLLRRALLP